MAVAFDAQYRRKGHGPRNNGDFVYWSTIGSGLTKRTLVVQIAAILLSVPFPWFGIAAEPNQAMTAIGTTTFHRRHVGSDIWLGKSCQRKQDASVDRNAITVEMYIRCGAYSGVDQTGGATSFAITTGPRNKYRAIGCHYKRHRQRRTGHNWPVQQSEFSQRHSSWTIDNSGPELARRVSVQWGRQPSPCQGCCASSDWCIGGAICCGGYRVRLKRHYSR